MASVGEPGLGSPNSLESGPGTWRQVKGVESIRVPMGVSRGLCQWGQFRPTVPSPKTHVAKEGQRPRESKSERETQAGTQADGEAGFAGARRGGRDGGRPGSPRNTPRHRSLTCSSGPVVDPTAGIRSHRLRGAEARAAELALVNSAGGARSSRPPVARPLVGPAPALPPPSRRGMGQGHGLSQ